MVIFFLLSLILHNTWFEGLSKNLEGYKNISLSYMSVYYFLSENGKDFIFLLDLIFATKDSKHSGILCYKDEMTTIERWRKEFKECPLESPFMKFVIFWTNGFKRDFKMKTISLKISIQHTLNTENSNEPNNMKKFFICSIFYYFVSFYFKDFSGKILDPWGIKFDF